MKNSWFLLLLLLLPLAPVSAQTEGLELSISSLVLYQAGEDSEVDYLVDASISVNNPTENPIEFTHSDLCRFKLEFTYTPDGIVDYYPFGCAEALEIVQFQPGITLANATGGLKLENGSEILPNGNYTVGILLYDYQLEPVTEINGASFGVVDNEVADIYYDIPVEFDRITPTTHIDGPGLTEENGIATSGDLNFPLLFSFFVLPITWVNAKKRDHA